MRSKPTTRDIAHLIGVSQSTVSRALRGDPAVAPETTERVRLAAERLRYTPNLAARSLSTARTNTVGVVVSDITNPFYPELVEILHDEFHRAGYRTLLVNAEEDAPSLLRGAVDGAVLLSATIGSGEAAALADGGVPVVLLNRHSGEDAADAVTTDNRMGGNVAGAALLDLGHVRVGYIAGSENTSTNRDREQGLREELSRRGIAFDETLRRTVPYSHQGGYQACLELLSLPKPPTAVVCASDIIAFGALDAARRLEIDVPGELSVVGFDDVEMSSWEAFRLTTVRQPFAAMGREAARLLLDRIGSDVQLPPRRRLFPADLVVRGTTAPPGATRA